MQWNFELGRKIHLWPAALDLGICAEYLVTDKYHGYPYGLQPQCGYSSPNLAQENSAKELVLPLYFPRGPEEVARYKV